LHEPSRGIRELIDRAAEVVYLIGPDNGASTIECDGPTLRSALDCIRRLRLPRRKGLDQIGPDIGDDKVARRVKRKPCWLACGNARVLPDRRSGRPLIDLPAGRAQPAGVQVALRIANDGVNEFEVGIPDDLGGRTVKRILENLRVA